MPQKPGIGSHQSASAITDTWLTPPHVLSALGVFDLDPCAAPLPRPWETALHHYTAPAQDGLRLPWFGRVWMNPPYGHEMTKWLHRLAEHNRGTALIFARTETRPFFAYVWEKASAVLFLEGRLHFHFPDGTRALANGGAPSALVSYGRQDAEQLLDCGLGGHVVPLNRALMIHMGLSDLSGPTWRDLILSVMREAGGVVSLESLYSAIEGTPKVRSNPNWRAKVRQTVARCGLSRVGVAQYALPL